MSSIYRSTAAESRIAVALNLLRLPGQYYPFLWSPNLYFLTSALSFKPYSLYHFPFVAHCFNDLVFIVHYFSAISGVGR